MARVLLVSLALWLGLCIGSSFAVDAPTCEQVREQAKNYTWKQIALMARRHGLTAEQLALVRDCLKDKK